jgi:hypothetical protein
VNTREVIGFFKTGGGVGVFNETLKKDNAISAYQKENRKGE